MLIRNAIARLRLFKWPPRLWPNYASIDNTCQCNFQKLERYLFIFETLILWENPIFTVLCIVASYILFWLFSSIEFHVFEAIGVFLLSSTLCDVWTTHIWPEISVRHPSLHSTRSACPQHSMPVVGKLVELFGSSSCDKLALLLQLRHQQPAVFYCVSLLSWVGLLLLGRSVSGAVFLYCCLMGAIICPGIYIYCLPIHLKTTVATYATCLHQAFTKYSDGSVEEDYLPVTTSEDQALLTRASDMQQDAYDSITNPGSSSDMVSGLGLMPSHEEDSLASLSDLAVSLLPLDPSHCSHSPTPSSNGSDSGKSDQQIKFQRGSFMEDSSSDEEVFTRDLEFAAADEMAPGQVGLTSLISQAVGGAMCRFKSNLQPPHRPQRSNSEDDFEIISRDELNNS